MITNIKNFADKLNLVRTIAVVSGLISIAAIWYCYTHGYIIAYGDSESHLNIAKRVVDSITPGFAQLGGIWLPLPHLLMVPLVKIDFLWRTGLAGSIISGLAFVVSSVFIYKITYLLTQNKAAGIVAVLVFVTNPNILYLQSTPMTELLLIAFFTLSSFYFISYIKNQANLNYLMLAGFFGFCASLTRYDGWFLVLIEALIISIINFPVSLHAWKKLEGTIILYSTLAFFGILLWLTWGYLILGDPLYFTHSEFSAKSQQGGWLARGELPAYKHLLTSGLYYFFTSMSNVGVFIFAVSLLGFLVYIFYRPSKEKFLVALLLTTAFIFYVVTLYLGQSVIFIRPLTPASFEWTLFNVRYGIMMVPAAAIFFAYLFSKIRPVVLKSAVIGIFMLQFGLFASGRTQVLSFEDGIHGLSSQNPPDAQNWIAEHYDSGMVLMDDYARTVSVVKTGIPMQEMIYVGNKPYWEESLVTPDKYATWVIMQKDDSVWKSIIDNPTIQDRLYAHFQKVYTSPNILIFHRTDLAKN